MSARVDRVHVSAVLHSSNPHDDRDEGVEADVDLYLVRDVETAVALVGADVVRGKVDGYIGEVVEETIVAVVVEETDGRRSERRVNVSTARPGVNRGEVVWSPWELTDRDVVDLAGAFGESAERDLPFPLADVANYVRLAQHLRPQSLADPARCLDCSFGDADCAFRQVALELGRFHR